MFRRVRGVLCIFFGIFMLTAVGYAAFKGGIQANLLGGTVFAVVAIWWGLRLFKSPEAEPSNPYMEGRKKDLQLQAHLFKENAWHTLALIAANVFVFYLVNHSLQSWTLTKEAMLSSGADFAPLVARGQIWRLITGAFLHYDFGHILGNMIALLTVGRYVDYYYGPKRFYFIYFISALAASLASNVMHPSIFCVGASGAIFGLYGAFFATFVIKHPDKSKLKFSGFAITYIILHILKSISSGFGQAGIDNAAHVGGFLAGASLGTAILASEFDWELVRNTAIGGLVGIFAIMQFTTYRHVPSPSQLEAREASRKEWIDLADKSNRCAAMINHFQALLVDIQGKRVSVDQAVQIWQTKINPEMESLRSEIYGTKVLSGAAYQAQLDLYNSVIVTQKIGLGIFAGRGREVASTASQDSLQAFKRAVETIKTNLAQE